MSDWSVGKKVFMICMVIVFTVGNYIILTAMWPVILDMVGIAQADPVLSGNHASDFAYYAAAVSAAPWWLYCVPFIAGIVETFAILYAKDIRDTVVEGVGQIREGFDNRR